MNDLHRVRYVTEHYAQLQGFRLLPLSAVFFGSALCRLAFPPATRPRLSGVSALALLGGVILLSLIAQRYYERHFGRVRALPWRSGAITIVGCCAAVVWLVWVQEVRPWPVSLPILFIAVVLARLGLVADRLRIHYLWIAIGCGLFAALQPLGASMHAQEVGLDVLIGSSCLVAAVGDDHVLRSTLQRDETP